MSPCPHKLHYLGSTVNKRSPSKGRLSWVSATHPAQDRPPSLPKDPAFLYQNVKIRELLPGQWSPSFILSSQILQTLIVNPCLCREWCEGHAGSTLAFHNLSHPALEERLQMPPARGRDISNVTSNPKDWGQPD